MTFTVISSGRLNRSRLGTQAATSAIPGKQQLTLGLWGDDFGDTAGLSHWRYLSNLEREAESALFDWTESRDSPNAPALWRIFARKSELLAQALARGSQSNLSGRDGTE